MRKSLDIKISGLRLFNGIKKANVNLAAVNTDLRPEAVSLAAYPENTSFAGNCSKGAVLPVHVSFNVSQVAKPVVVASAVNVVNVSCGPAPGDIQPRKPMSRMQLAVHPDEAVATAVNATSDRAGLVSAFAGDVQARENARVGVEVQKGAETFRCQFEH